MTLGFLDRLVDTSGFPPRWHCGIWTPLHGWLHILSDIGIWAAYFTIPIMFWWLITKRDQIRFRGQFVLFAMFIFFCGSTHLMEAIIFWWPAYRLAGLLKLLTAICSWATVLSLVRVAPAALSMRTHEELEREVIARQTAERQLTELNEQLEQRVQARIKELAVANAQLHEQRDWFRTTLASIGDGVISTDAQGHIVMLNDVARQLTGWNPEAAVGQPLEQVFQVISETTREKMDNPAHQTLSQRMIVGPANHALLIARDGSERPIADSAAPIRDADGNVTGAVLVFRDVTETRRLEEQYRQSQKMEAIGRFAGGIAHDFNNLLTVINGYCQLLAADGQMTDSSRDYLGEVHAAGNRAAALTQQLLAFGRMQLAHPQILDLNDVVLSINRMLTRLIGEDIRMETELSQELWQVNADRGQLEQILVNLAVNARDAMPRGGTIRLSTENLTITPNHTAMHGDAPAGQYVTLAFRDNGQGMDESVRQRAFEPYFTTKELGKGTGLGLATVFGIVKQSQGFITLTSKLDQGTQVRIYLPRVIADGE